MRALRLTAINELSLQDLPVPEPGPGEVRVRLKAAALNHRDLWIKLGQYAGLRYPCTPGSDGAGVIEAVGDGVPTARVGEEVIINPSLDWGDAEAAQSPEFSILGLPRDGTLAEAIVVPVGQTSPRPAHLSWGEAAALPLAGLTAFRAVASRARVRAGERVLITGVGGGVATFALQYAVAAGAHTWVSSSSPDKLSRAAELGARGGFDYRDPAWGATAAKTGLFDVIIDSAGGEGFEALIDLAAPGGRIVFFGATRGNPPVLPMRKVFWKQLSLLGTTMGSPADWAAMLAETARIPLTPVISEVFPLARGAEAFALMERGDQLGKIVIETA
jgi:NADPH:quinone reductase-like Zn-dependent oxidoreductase